MNNMTPLERERLRKQSEERTRSYGKAIDGTMDAAFDAAGKAIDAIGNAADLGRLHIEYEEHGGKEFEKGKKKEKKGDYDAAIDLYQQAIDKGLPAAYYDLAVCSRKAGIADGQVFTYFIKGAQIGDYQKSRFYKPADGSNGNAEYEVALCYRDGIGTKKNDAKAFEYFVKGGQKADFDVAVCYHGGIGVERNTAKAVERLKEASTYFHRYDIGFLESLGYKKGDVLNQLGICYRDGGPGLAADSKQAIEYFKSAANAGNREAFANLAGMGIKYNVALEGANKFLSVVCAIACGFGMALLVNWLYVKITGADKLPVIVSLLLMAVFGFISFKTARTRNKITLVMLALAALGWLNLFGILN